MLFALLAILCFSSVLGSTSYDSNLYMDNVISSRLSNTLRSRGLTPATMPNFQNGFFHKLSATTVQVRSDYSRGQLSGLQYVQRARDCTPPYWSFGNATLNCTLSLRNLGISYVAQMGYGSVSVNNVYVMANVTATDLVVVTTTGQYRNLPELSRFEIRSVGQIKPKFTGIGPMNTFQKTLESHFIGSATTYLMGILNNQFRFALHDSVRALTMPMPR